VLSAMARRVVQNRVLLVVVIGVMLLVIGVTIYFVARGDGSGGTGLTSSVPRVTSGPPTTGKLMPSASSAPTR